MKSSPYADAPRLPDGATVELASVLPGEGPLMLEIGPGRGAFALAYAALHPEHRVLALEIRRKHAALLDERFRKRESTRARCFSEDARFALPRLVPDACVQYVAIHFPDPWWKKRHAKRLLVGEGFVTQLARLVRPGGFVFAQTDVPDRAEQIANAFGVCALFQRRIEAPGTEAGADSPFAPARSNRETRAIADGLPVYRMIFDRV